MLIKESPDTVLPASATSTPDKLNRSLSVWNSLTIGFAVVSPVVGPLRHYWCADCGNGGGWFAALALCLVMQLLVATVYAELSSQFPDCRRARTSGHGSWEGASPGSMPESSTLAPRSPC